MNDVIKVAFTLLVLTGARPALALSCRPVFDIAIFRCENGVCEQGPQDGFFVKSVNGDGGCSTMRSVHKLPSKHLSLPEEMFAKMPHGIFQVRIFHSRSLKPDFKKIHPLPDRKKIAALERDWRQRALLENAINYIPHAMLGIPQIFFFFSLCRRLNKRRSVHLFYGIFATAMAALNATVVLTPWVGSVGILALFLFLAQIVALLFLFFYRGADRAGNRTSTM